MGRKIKITNEQYQLLKEMELAVDTSKTNGDINQAMKQELGNAKKYGVPEKDITFKVSGDQVQSNGMVSDSKIISVKQLKENRLKMLRENSQYFSLNDFLKKIK